MKKYFWLLIIGLFFTACGEEEVEESIGIQNQQIEKNIADESSEENSRIGIKNSDISSNVIVSGNITNGFNTPLVIEANTQKGSLQIGKGFTDSEGNFRIEGAIEDMGLYQLRIEEKLKEGKEPKVIPMTLEPEDSVFIQLDFDNFNQTPQYSGTRWAKPLNGYMQQMEKFVNWQKSLSNPQQYGNEKLMEMMKKEKKSMDDFTVKMINKDPSNPANILLISNVMPMMGYEHFDKSHLNALQKIKTAFEKDYAGHPMTKNITSQVQQVEKGYKEYVDFTVNNKAPEISLKGTDGNVRKLSDLKGKYVLIDFWASWCGPCRKENPHVVGLYNKYKDKNFEVFSVSLDTDKNRWENAIAADGLIWKNHVSDLKGWQSDVVQLYGFRGIPHTVLVDPEGNIVASKLRGAALEQKLKELLG